MALVKRKFRFFVWLALYFIMSYEMQIQEKNFLAKVANISR